MKRELYEKLLLRAKRIFLKDAIYDAKDGYYDLALLNLEKAVQLLLKSELFKKSGDFPRTSADFTGEEKLLEDNILVIALLEDAYFEWEIFPKRVQ
ncbi:MAG: hypothetical protein DRN88_01785 [Candidatus Hydrothermarchaeota archaeon]|nr:MAG: hypothetical protein DRN88_01785 [Candidatus Hydrothermarchaeota archaeon]